MRDCLNNKLITIVGPTASGKTSLATRLASLLDAEIISGDSRQVYKQMDIGTGKDLTEYIVGDKKIPYHLIDICPAGEKYNLFRYQQDFYKVFNDIQTRNIPAILCGGTGLYIEAVLKSYEMAEVPENKELRERLANKSIQELTLILSQYKALHNTTDVDTVKRAIRAIEIAEYSLNNSMSQQKFSVPDSVIFGIDVPRDIRRNRITKRLHDRLNEGMVREVESLLNQGIPSEDLIYYGLEYKFVTQHLINEINYSTMVKQLETAIHQFAKRQMTWFRGMERRGFNIHWIDGTLSIDGMIDRIMNIPSKP